MTTIGYVVGSLSSTSINRKVIDAIGLNAPEGVQLREIPIKDLPLYSQDHDADFPPVARDFKAAIDASDAVVVATPQFNDSFSGVVKNAVDWSSRPWGQHSFNGKPVAVASASVAPHGGAKAADLLAQVLAFGEARVSDARLSVAVGEDTFDADGNFADVALREQARGFVTALAGSVQN